ncbi:sulfate/molybdate ABC transporter ATP-binding protein [Snodgrassella communis]|uniref:sulfate/molybdate ABC transporter ATP-binding protein n=1 Tax=Snodgrassella communis TaxID=2946699 RepID=UPI001EF4CDEF|nr:ATP-binding cassette domain-containing protein [Snodgrassella communis]
MLDFNFQKTLQRTDGSQFTLDISLCTQAPRTVIMGASGSGKSLMLKAIAGLLTPTQGHIIVNGVPLFQAPDLNLSPQQRKLAYVFQDYALFPHLNVRQNIACGIQQGLFNPRKSSRDPEVEHWLTAMQLNAVAEQYPAHLSGGQRQRVALARALIARPSAILLDEPFSALDTQLRAQMRTELVNWQYQLNLPMLLITHDPEDATAFDAQIWHMDNGHLYSTPHSSSHYE